MIHVVPIVSPPIWSPAIGIVGSSCSHTDTENNDSRNGNSRIQGSRGDIIVLEPPVVSVLADPVHEDETTSAPHGEVLYEIVSFCMVSCDLCFLTYQWDSRRHHTSSVEDQRNMHIFDPGVGILLCKEIEWDRENETDQEEIQHGRVWRVSCEHLARTNGTPND
jgi:hypothetical protein